MAAIVFVGWKSYFIAKHVHIFQDAQAGLPLGVSVFKGDTSALLRARVYNKVCRYFELNGIYG